MANIKSSIKDSKNSKKRRFFNASNRSMIRTYIKKVNKAINLKNKSLAQCEYKKMQIILDKFSNKGLIHKNKAARHKSIMFKKINKINII
ncbi:30S ribosomal protein S20 [Buchnera aphidicola]|uniref:30S ribosomal protein S20 n=1 Tax=Buchnera aphidicola TaxID=9 RepID=UPI0031B82649